MAIETLDDIVEQLADNLGIYGAHVDLQSDEWKDAGCHCRVCFASALKPRILAAVEIERRLGSATQQMSDESRGYPEGAK